MSVTEQFQQLHSLSSRFLRVMVDTPMHHLFGRRRPAAHAGAPPGTLFISSDAGQTVVRLRRIDSGEVELFENPSPEQIAAVRARGGRLWLDVAGFADDEFLRRIGELFELHPLTLADLVNVERQTKVDSLDDRNLIIVQALNLDPATGEPGLSQLGLLLMDEVLLTFRERPGTLFEPVLARLERSTSRLRSQPLDYLASSLLDVAVDASFPVVETLAEQVDEIEERVMAGSAPGVMTEIHRQRRALISLGRLFWRQRDLLARLLRDDQIFRQETQIYLRDVYDRTVQLLDMVETTREQVSSLVEIHLSISATRANQIMKTLTIMASIFIPLTFIAGVYGMNFERMPELGWDWGYPAVLLLMLGVSVGLLVWFRLRGWLGGGG